MSKDPKTAQLKLALSSWRIGKRRPSREKLSGSDGSAPAKHQEKTLPLPQQPRLVGSPDSFRWMVHQASTPTLARAMPQASAAKSHHPKITPGRPQVGWKMTADRRWQWGGVDIRITWQELEATSTKTLQETITNMTDGGGKRKASAERQEISVKK